MDLSDVRSVLGTGDTNPKAGASASARSFHSSSDGDRGKNAYMHSWRIWKKGIQIFIMKREVWDMPARSAFFALFCQLLLDFPRFQFSAKAFID
jgi:hypothetical protein